MMKASDIAHTVPLVRCKSIKGDDLCRLEYVGVSSHRLLQSQRWASYSLHVQMTVTMMEIPAPAKAMNRSSKTRTSQTSPLKYREHGPDPNRTTSKKSWEN